MQEKYENRINASLQGLIYDCANPEELARFYAKLLGGILNGDSYGGYSVTVPNLNISLGFQIDEDYRRPIWPGTKGDQLQMLHIDLKVDDLEEAKTFALSIGATLPEEQFCQPDWDVQWYTLLDPAGHPFCIFSEEYE